MKFRLESRLQSCSTQLRCSGCCTTMKLGIPTATGRSLNRLLQRHANQYYVELFFKEYLDISHISNLIYVSSYLDIEVWQLLPIPLRFLRLTLPPGFCRIPLVLGGGAAGLRLATHLRDALSTRSSWWMPFYQADASTADTKAEVTRLMERITEAMAAVAWDWKLKS